MVMKTFRFTGTVFVSEDKKHNFTLQNGINVLGRGPLLKIKDQHLSRKQIELFIDPSSPKVEMKLIGLNPINVVCSSSDEVIELHHKGRTNCTIGDGDAFTLLQDRYVVVLKVEEIEDRVDEPERVAQCDSIVEEDFQPVKTGKNFFEMNIEEKLQIADAMDPVTSSCHEIMPTDDVNINQDENKDETESVKINSPKRKLMDRVYFGSEDQSQNDSEEQAERLRKEKRQLRLEQNKRKREEEKLKNEKLKSVNSDNTPNKKVTRVKLKDGTSIIVYKEIEDVKAEHIRQPKVDLFSDNFFESLNQFIEDKGNKEPQKKKTKKREKSESRGNDTEGTVDTKMERVEDDTGITNDQLLGFCGKPVIFQKATKQVFTLFQFLQQSKNVTYKFEDLTLDQIEAMTLGEIRDMLKFRGVSSSGKKKELKERLSKLIVNKEQNKSCT